MDTFLLLAIVTALAHVAIIVLDIAGACVTGSAVSKATCRAINLTRRDN